MSRALWKLLLASPAALAASGLFSGVAFAAPEATPEIASPTAVVVNNTAIAANEPPIVSQPPRTEVGVVVTPSPVSLQPSPVLAQSTPNLPSVAELDTPIPVSATPAPIGQVTSVDQLSDVRPTDWAYQAVQSLVERYGCIAGYPNATFRGNRAATRYELAAALNACLDVISDRFATKEDLLAVRKLQEEFAKELAALKGRVNQLEARTAKLESQQFSTTTKLRAVAVMSFSDALLGTDASSNAAVRNNGDNPIVTYRVRLNLDTSFSGKDLLRTRLQAGNVPSFAAGDGLGLYNTSRLAYDVPGVPSYRIGANGTGGSAANLFTLDKLFYRFPVFGKGLLQVDALRAELNDNIYNFNPYLESSDRGALSRFFRFNPIYRVGGDAGVTFSYPVIQQDKRDILRLSAAYYGGQTSIPGQTCTPDAREAACYSPGQPVRNFPNFADGGLFGGPYSASVQLEYSPIKDLRLGFLYTRSYGLDVSGGTGTVLAARPFSGNSATFDSIRDQSANNFGFQFFYQPIKRIAFSGWVGYSQVFGGDANAAGQDRANVLNWAVTLAAPDVWRKGDLAAIAFGQAPTVISGNGALNSRGAREDDRATYLLEAQYRFQINPNISVTPGVIAVFNPNGGNNLGTPGTADNSTTLIGVIRTTFTF
jgi:Carbohydrate-selective porin, OprB family/S-layer homology domain